MEGFRYKYDDLFNPTLEALHSLGSSGTILEIEDKVAQIMKLTDEEVSDIHKGNRTKLSYRLAWARNYLKRFGLLDNSARGVWGLTPEGVATVHVDKEVVNQTVKQKDKQNEESGSRRVPVESETDSEAFINDPDAWRDELISVIQSISADAFERLCQRMLRELGFSNVEVTGRSGDGGIDGRGVVKVGGVLSFHVVFQCKRYQGSVSAGLVRDFRGAMVGRADKA